jgi:hypothetical protein
MMFGTMGTQPAGIGEKEKGRTTMSQPTRPEDPGQEAHCRDRLKDNQ